MDFSSVETAVKLEELRQREHELRTLLQGKGSQLPSVGGRGSRACDAGGELGRPEEALEEASAEDLDLSHISADIENSVHESFLLDETESESFQDEGDHNASVLSNGAGTNQFEDMLEGVVSKMRSLREEDSLTSCVAWWRAYTCSSRKKQKATQMAKGLARWNIMQSFFLIMHTQTRAAVAAKEILARSFRQSRLMHSVVLLWGPLRRLEEAERLGVADAEIRTMMKRWRIKTTYLSWTKAVSQRRRMEELVNKRHLKVMGGRLKSWLAASRWREKLRPSTARLHRRTQLLLLEYGMLGLSLNQIGGEKGEALMLSAVCGAAMRAFKWQLQDGNEERRTLLQKKAVWAWRVCAEGRRAMGKRVHTHCTRWHHIQAHITGTSFLRRWRERVGEAGERENMLQALLEYHNLDERYQGQILNVTLTAWAAWASDVRSAKLRKAASQRNRAQSQFALRAWRVGVEIQRQELDSLRQFQTQIAEKMLTSWRRWLVAGCWSLWVCHHENEQHKLRKALDMAKGVVGKETRLWADYIFGKWKRQRTRRVADEVSSWRTRKGLYEVWKGWRRELLDAEVLYSAEWQRAGHVSVLKCQARAMLGLQLHAFNEAERCEGVLRQWGVTVLSRCWVGWMGAVKASRAEREVNWTLAETERRIRQASAQRIKRDVMQVLKEVANEGRAQKFAEALEDMRGELVCFKVLAGWRERVAWFNDLGLLLSYRDPGRVSKWAAQRAGGALRWLRWGMRGMLEGRVRAKRAERRALMMRESVLREGTVALIRAWSQIVRVDRSWREGDGAKGGRSGGDCVVEDGAQSIELEVGTQSIEEGRRGMLGREGGSSAFCLEGFQVHVTGRSGKPVARSLTMDDAVAEERMVAVKESVEAPRRLDEHPSPHPQRSWEAAGVAAPAAHAVQRAHISSISIEARPWAPPTPQAQEATPSARRAWEELSHEQQQDAYQQRQRAMLDSARAVRDTEGSAAESWLDGPMLQREITPRYPEVTPRLPQHTPLHEQSMPGSAASQASTARRHESPPEHSEQRHGAGARDLGRDKGGWISEKGEARGAEVRERAKQGMIKREHGGAERPRRKGMDEIGREGARREEGVRGVAAGGAGGGRGAGAKPRFYVHASNGWQLVSDHLTSLGWDRIKFSDSQARFELKWVASPTEVDYEALSDGQLVNQIKGMSALTNKSKLIGTLARADRQMNPFSRQPLPDCFPPTFPLEQYLEMAEAEVAALGPVIVKPSNKSKGRGVSVAGSRSELLRLLATPQPLPHSKRAVPNSSGPTSLRQSASSQSKALRSSGGTAAGAATRKGDARSSAARSRGSPSPALGSVRVTAHSSAERAKDAATSGPLQVSLARSSTGSAGSSSGWDAQRSTLEAAKQDASENLIVQKYVMNPLLVEGCKFDLRVFVLIARTKPLLAFYHDGYLRIAMERFDPARLDRRFANITNLSVQKEHPSFVASRERKVWSFEQLRAHIASQRREEVCDQCGRVAAAQADGDGDGDGDGEPGARETDESLCGCDVLEERIKPQIKGCLRAAVLAAHADLDKRRGLFSLLGADLVVDTSLGVHLLELNKNPDLELHTRQLGNLLPGVVREAINIVLEANAGDGTSAPGCVECFEHLCDEGLDHTP